MDVHRVTSFAQLQAAAELFDTPPQAGFSARFLAEPGHHLLLAYEGERPVGMVSGVELTHPDKGTEMFLYELSVAEDARGRGTGRRLTDALGALATERGCTGMWVLTEPDNTPATRTYRAAGGSVETNVVLFGWEFGTQEQEGGTREYPTRPAR